METKQSKQQDNTKFDLYAVIRDTFISKLEKGIVPWHRPWGSAGMPTSLITGQPYRGLNALILGVEGYEQNFFLTAKQLQAIGGKVIREEHGHMVIHVEYKDGKYSTRYYKVFNIRQCENIPEEYLAKAVVQPPKASADIIAGMPNCPVIRSKEKDVFYNPKEDVINLPKKLCAKKDAEYYTILFHQLVHATGHTSRLNRNGSGDMPEFGGDRYSLEELTAEIGTCLLQSFIGFDEAMPPMPQIAQGWKEKLKGDKFFIFKAAKAAYRAVSYILNENPANETPDA